MKNPHLTLSVPRLFIQITIAALIGFLLQQKLLDYWIQNQIPEGLFQDILEFISIFTFSMPIFYLIVYRDLKKKNIGDQILLDISEKVKQEKSSDQLYRRLFESNMDFALVVDINGVIIDINQVGEEATGYKREELKGLHYSKLVYPEELPETKTIFEKVLQGKSIRYETKGTNKDGEIVYTLVSSMPLFNEGEVSGVFSLIRDITEQREHLQMIHSLAYHDSLTELPNRHYFSEKIETILTEAKSQKGKVALLYLDLDRLKEVNDNFGHAAGDKLLRHTSMKFREVIHDRGFISRIGGDEFTVIIPSYHSVERYSKLLKNCYRGLMIRSILKGI